MKRYDLYGYERREWWDSSLSDERSRWQECANSGHPPTACGSGQDDSGQSLLLCFDATSLQWSALLFIQHGSALGPANVLDRPSDPRGTGRGPSRPGTLSLGVSTIPLCVINKAKKDKRGRA